MEPKETQTNNVLMEEREATEMEERVAWKIINNFESCQKHWKNIEENNKQLSNYLTTSIILNIFFLFWILA